MPHWAVIKHRSRGYAMEDRFRGIQIIRDHVKDRGYATVHKVKIMPRWGTEIRLHKAEVMPNKAEVMPQRCRKQGYMK
jgi:hypothetical protein